MMASASEEIRYFDPRLPNVTLDIAGIRFAWDRIGAFPGESLISDVRTSPFGNINVGGRTGGTTAPTVPAWHPSFEELLEPGIRELCLVVAREAGWITYTSCEGHDYGCLGIPCSMRHIGILPRNAEEYRRIHDCLRSVIARTLRSFKSDSVDIGLILHQLSDFRESADVIDLVFVPAFAGSWRAYFEEIDSAYAHLTTTLRQYCGFQ